MTRAPSARRKSSRAGPRRLGTACGNAYSTRHGDRIEIRAACEADADFIAGLVPSLLEFGSPAWKDAEALAPGFAEVLAGAVRAQGSRSTVLVAESADGTRLGFISLRVREDVTGVKRGHVADVGVIEDAHRMGVGSALMRAGEAWARERGLPVLSLDLWATNERARAFYETLGYSAESFCLFKRLD
jgi:ribosomal protein S18 acetylase RimI-like enzyme